MQPEEPATADAETPAKKKLGPWGWVGISALALLFVACVGGLLAQQRVIDAHNRSIDAAVPLMVQELGNHGFTARNRIDSGSNGLLDFGSEPIPIEMVLEFGVCSEVTATAHYKSPTDIKIHVVDRTSNTKYPVTRTFPIRDITYQQLKDKRADFNLKSCFLE